MSESKLAPCPFCGGEDITIFYEGSHDWVFDCKAKTGCGATVGFYIPHIGDETAAAIKAWNTRHNEQPEEDIEMIAGAARQIMDAEECT